MADICLELDDALIARLSCDADALGVGVEEYVRQLLIDNAPRRSVLEADNGYGRLEDESVCKAAEIEAEARRLGCDLGWRFMTCPEANAADARMLFVTLNPGGRERHGPAWSQEAGSAYRVESWNGEEVGKSRLQRQVQSLFSFLGVCDDKVFSANYVPFRSPNWADLSRRDEAINFSAGLWRWLLPKVHFDIAVCMGKGEPARSLAVLLHAELEGKVAIGWGAVTGDRYRLPDGRKLIALPHLSRFSIFDREESREPLRTLFEL